MAGIFCAITHGIGIFIWASATVAGLGAVLVSQPIWYGLIRLAGAVFLLYLGFSALLSRPNEASDVPTTAQPEYVRVATFRSAGEDGAFETGDDIVWPSN